MFFMPPSETDYLKKMIDGSDVFLEYGSGGSTTYAINSNLSYVISVENDKNFLDSLKKTPKSIPVFIDLGSTSKWGYPKDHSLKCNWKKYPTVPWKVAEDKKLCPDLILIDGRFRVACFLYSIAHAKKGAKIFWDDYEKRPHYHIVEKLCFPKEKIGRARVFVKEEEIIFDEKLFIKYCEDPR